MANTDGARTKRLMAPAYDYSAISVLLMAGDDYALPLREALESRRALHVTATTDAAIPVDLLRGSQFDAVLMQLSQNGATPLERARRVRELAGAAALIVVGAEANAALVEELEADDYVGVNESAAALERTIRGAIERHRLRAQVEASDARFRSIIERNADGIVIVDDEGIIRFVNPAAEKMFGRDATALIGENFGFAVIAGEATEIDTVGYQGQQSVVAELRATETTWEGRHAQLITVHDITDRKRAEERAQRLVWEQAAREQAEQASRRSRFLVEAGVTLDSSLDPDTTLVNLAKLIVPRVADWCVIDLLDEDRIRRVAGVHADPDKQPLLDELRQRYPPQFGSRQPSVRVIETGTPELHRGLNRERIAQLALDEGHADLLLRLGLHSAMSVALQARERRLGSITFVCHERDFTDGDVALAEEIGSRAGRALENARLYEAALTANQAKADFLAVMSHELRTPLNAILGYTQLLLEGVSGEVDGSQQRHLQRIHTSASHLLHIIEEILTFASMEAGRAQVEPRSVQLYDIIDAVSAMVEPLSREKGLEFVRDVREPEATLFTDPVKVRQIILNLLTNAVKFTDHGRVELHTDVRGDELFIQVSDTGAGIEPEAIDAIFEPFRQIERPLTRHAGGTGLGLTVTQRLATMLGGNISVESQVGVGSTFTVTLPTRSEAASHSAQL